ncbi:hypothetical protein ACFQZZ_13995 [Nocardia sp. GCM10030253]|uniref:hypothetical protein n=1 Tax=Nocardia sp. GCM10030253 TaxID=3273404 RepID=UPI00363BF884
MSEGAAMVDSSPDLLMTLTVAAAHQLGYSCRAVSDDVVLSGPAGHVLVGLTNLRRMAAEEPRDQWPALVADYLSTGVLDLEVDHDPLDTSDFTMMRGLIRTRLYSAHGRARDVVRRRVAPGLMQRVLIDQVHTMVPITYPMLRQWPIDEVELFALAERNTRADGPLEMVTHAFDTPQAAGVEITMLCGISDYITAHAKWLGDYPVVGPAGTVFVVPSQRHIYAYPVTNLEVIRATTVLAQLAVLGYTQRPWPVSQDVYWWHHGAIDLAAATQHDTDELCIYPSDGFLTALDELPS